jgi:hypothetical protein
MRYGLSVSQFEQMFYDQRGKCAICKDDMLFDAIGSEKRTNVDHDHKTQQVRGLLCRTCNLLLGFANDSIAVLQTAIEYLKYHESKRRAA